MRCIQSAGSNTTCLSDGRTIELTESIGRGALGEVYRGVLRGNFGLGRSVAVKTFDVAPDNDEKEILREIASIARRAACVTHPGVVQLFEVDRAEIYGIVRPIIVTDLVEGESLANILASWRVQDMRVPLDFALVVGLRIAEALAAGLEAESRVVHGDLSPRQVLISKHGEVKVCDFGLGVLRQTISHVSSRDSIAFSSPEIARGQLPDPRSDVFSLGVVLHDMLIGPRFSQGTTTAAAAKMVRDGDLHAPVFAPTLTRELRMILDAALDPDPLSRYPHARALAFDLRREVLRMGLADAQTSVRHAIVGYCEVSGTTGESRTQPASLKPERPSGLVLRSSRPDVEDTNPGHKKARKVRA